MLYPQNHSSWLHLITELSDPRYLISVCKQAKLASKMGITNHMVYPERMKMSPTTWVIWLFVCLFVLSYFVSFSFFFFFLKRLIKKQHFNCKHQKNVGLYARLLHKSLHTFTPRKGQIFTWCTPAQFSWGD